MRLTCRPPERTKPKQPDLHPPSMTAIPTPIPSTAPPSPPLTTTPMSLPPPTPQFYSAPPVLSRDPKPYRSSLVVSPRPNQNDILKRIVKADDGIKKKKSTQHNAHYKSVNKGSKRGNVVPPPPLSKYKRPPPMVPHRPGDRYPLGIPYAPLPWTCVVD